MDPAQGPLSIRLFLGASWIPKYWIIGAILLAMLHACSKAYLTTRKSSTYALRSPTMRFVLELIFITLGKDGLNRG